MSTPQNRQEATELMQKIEEEIHKGIVGQKDFIKGLLQTVLAGGHSLIEGVPGLAKTRAVNLLSKVCKLSFQRLQFTPDLLPADIVGTQIFNIQKGSFSIKKGPIFSQFILADEINRAPAKVQSALLEAMQERQITIADQTFELPKPFFVFATQNPIEQEGTYPLPEAQVDRFLTKLVVDYPSPEDEQRIVKLFMNEISLPKLDSLLDADAILVLQKFTRDIFIEDKIIEYIANITNATRDPLTYNLKYLPEIIEIGASPRASIALAQAAKAEALIQGRDMVIPEDIKAVALPTLRHRIIPTYQALADNITSEKITEEVLKKIKVP